MEENIKDSISGKISDKTVPKIIVSFTSHPMRIEYVPEVLDSLYEQTRTPDIILLWLAEEQFPEKEKDLPERIVMDAAQGKLQIRWCYDLGSHKKYYYATKEYPEDIIITVDDDIHYDPRMIDTLYQSYRKFPNAVSAEKVMLIIFDKEGRLMPCSEWVVSYAALADEPSLQLMALGNRGVLYPPGIHDPTDFSLEKIKRYCCYRGTMFQNDSWLKIHELNAGIPVVCTGKELQSTPIDGTQSTSLRNSAKNTAELQEQEFRMWRDLADNLKAIKESPNFIASKEDATLKNIAPRLRLSLMEGGSCPSVSDRLGVIHYSLLELNKLTAQGLCSDKLSAYIGEYRDILSGLPDLDLLKSKSVAVSALADYGAVLRTRLFGSMFNSKECYMQMLKSWKLFFKEHPDCKAIYHAGYMTFLKNTEAAINEAESVLSKAETDEWKSAFEKALDEYPKPIGKEKPMQVNLERIRSVLKDL